MKFIKAAAMVFALMMTGSVYAAEVITETEHLGNWKINYVYTDEANKELLRGYISDKNSSLIDNSTQYYEGEHGLSLMHLKNQKMQDTYISALTSIDSSYLKPDTNYRFKFIRRTRMAFESQIRITGGVTKEVIENVNIEWGQGWTEYTYDFTTLPEPADVNIEICLLRGNHEYGGGGLYIDNVSLYEIDDEGNNLEENLIENGNFESEVITEPLADNVENASAEGRIASAYITWEVPADEDYKQARIYMVTDGGKQLLASIKPGVNSYLAGELENGTEYTFLIVSLDRRFNESDGIKVTCTTVPSPDVPDVSADDENDEIIGIDSTMEYKIDMGDWYTYGESNIPDLSGNHIVYVRVKETETAPVGFSKVLLFIDSATKFEPLKVNFTKTELKNTQLIIEGTVPAAPDANVIISLINADNPQIVMFIKQVKTDDDGKFSYTAVMNDYIDENGLAYVLTGEENPEHTDLTGIYNLKANSDKGLISDATIIYFGNSVSRKKAIEAMKNAESENDIEGIFTEHKNALSSLGFDTEKFADDASYRSCIKEYILNGGMDDIERENEMLESVADCNLVYALDTAENAATLQKIILENEEKVGLDYKGESFSDIISEGKQARIEWFFERMLADDFSTIDELCEKFVRYGALYDINTATYMTVADVLEENIAYFSPEADDAYKNYKKHNSKVAVNKAIITSGLLYLRQSLV